MQLDELLVEGEQRVRRGLFDEGLEQGDGLEVTGDLAAGREAVGDDALVEPLDQAHNGMDSPSSSFSRSSTSRRRLIARIPSR